MSISWKAENNNVKQWEGVFVIETTLESYFEVRFKETVQKLETQKLKHDNIVHCGFSCNKMHVKIINWLLLFNPCYIYCGSPI